MELAKKELSIGNACNILFTISADEEERAYADAAEKRRMDENYVRKLERQEGKDEGFKEGKEDGRKETKIEIAQSLLNNGVSHDIVMQSCGLSREALEAML